MTIVSVMEDGMGIHGRISVWSLVLGAALLLGCPAFAQEPQSFPEELRSFWEPSLPCDGRETSDRDSRFQITATQRLNYEEIEDVVSTELLTQSPQTWRIVTTSNVGSPDLQQPRIYVLKKDFLAVSDGQSARMYSRCK